MSNHSDISKTSTQPHARALLALTLFVAVVTAKVWVVQLLLLGGASNLALVLDLLFVFSLLAAIDLAFADLRLRSLLVADALVSGLLVILVVYYAYYGLLPSRQSLSMLGQAGAVGGGIVSLVNPFYLVLFVDIPLIAFWVIRSRRHGVDPLTGRRPGALVLPGARTPYVYQRRLVYVAALVVSIVLTFSVRTTAASADAQDTGAVASERGVGSYLAVALMPARPDTPVDSNKAKPSDFQARINKVAGTRPGAPRTGFTPGQAKGKNVIVIQVEALQAIAVGATVGGTSVTPNLDALIKESWYFPNGVSGAGVGTTADVEFVVNTSLYPPREVGASLGWSDRELTSLPRVLNSQGYESYTFHTNEVGFWNRSQFYPAIGFTRYFDRQYFGTDDKMAFGSSSDRVLFEKTIPRLKEAADAKRPFYAQVITMSSHFPFKNVPPDRRKLRLVPPYKGTMVGDYLTEAHYTDEQIGYFISMLKKSGLWDDSVVVLYGDHFGLPEPQNAREARALRELAGHDYNKADRTMVPRIVHLPGQEAGSRVVTPVGQVDVAPTIADALDVDLSQMAHFGRSVLRSGEGIISAGGLVGQGAYVDGSVFALPGASIGESQVFDAKTREAMPTSRASDQKLQAAKELLLLSQQYVASLPVRKDFDPDAEITFPRRK